MRKKRNNRNYVSHYKKRMGAVIMTNKSANPNSQVQPQKPHNHSQAPNRFGVVPISNRMLADDRYTGRGVNIAYVDSGFYPHSDLGNRIAVFHDVSGEESNLGDFKVPLAYHWHGTQTTVVAAGDGRLSEGIYRGLASESGIVLVKVSSGGKIAEENIERGLRWILENRKKYHIRVLNISLGGDQDLPCGESHIDKLAEECVRQGIVVVAAAGNSGNSARPHSIPPANAPSVITVGGYSDGNQIDSAAFTLYHSNYGKTADGTVKPELIAPAMRVAAPILPETYEYKTAEMLEWIYNAPDYKFGSTVFEHWHQAGLPERILYQRDIPTQRLMIERVWQERGIVATHYQHVDGTSFAAPIVASVVAQMLEANPELTPSAVKNVLISTAERLTHFPVERQGFGRINAGRAVTLAKSEMHTITDHDFRPPRIESGRILFFFHGDEVEEVSLCGDFNGWESNKVMFQKLQNGFWEAKIDLLPPGKHCYKFVVEQNLWIEDASNGLKEPDGYGGFNSILHIR